MEQFSSNCQTLTLLIRFIDNYTLPDILTDTWGFVNPEVVVDMCIYGSFITILLRGYILHNDDTSAVTHDTDRLQCAGQPRVLINAGDWIQEDSGV